MKSAIRVPGARPVPSTTPGQAVAPPVSSKFSTVLPTGNHSGLLALLAANKVDVSNGSWLLTLLSSVLPIVLLIGVMVYLGRQMQKGQQGALGFGRSKARLYQTDGPTVTFADVAGEDEAKAELTEVVGFLKNPKPYCLVGARLPHGILLVGPPGTGKTLLARAVAGEAHVPFLSISASEFVELFVGVGASRVRDLLEQARTQATELITSHRAELDGIVAQLLEHETISGELVRRIVGDTAQTKLQPVGAVAVG